MRRLEIFEGGAEFVAEKDGKFYLIRDERTMADFIPEGDEDLLDKILTVLEFDSEGELNDYIRSRNKEKIKETHRKGKIVPTNPLVAASRKQSRRKGRRK